MRPPRVPSSPLIARPPVGWVLASVLAIASALLVAFIAAMEPAVLRVPVVAAECYTLQYGLSSKPTSLAGLPASVRLLPAPHPGERGAEWGTVDTLPRPFVRGFPFYWHWWAAGSESLVFQYGDPFSGVAYYVERTRTGLRGRATFYSDLIGPEPEPWVRVIGWRRPCPAPANEALQLTELKASG